MWLNAAPTAAAAAAAAAAATTTAAAAVTATTTTTTTTTTHWRTVLLKKLTGSQQVKKFPHFTEPEGSLPRLQGHATCPYSEPDQSSPCHSILDSEDPF